MRQSTKMKFSVTNTKARLFFFSSDICFFHLTIDFSKSFYHVYCMKLGFREMSDNRLIIN